MKPTQPLFWNKWMRNGRRPARPPLRFTECKKLVLRNTVSGSGKQTSDLACHSQVIDMMTCLKEYDFDQNKCSSQINAFKSCYQNHLESLAAAKNMKNKNEPVPGQTKLTVSQVNNLLKRYPQPH